VSKPVYLLVGERFLADEALDKVRAEAQTDALSEALFDGSVEAAELMTALETPSLLGDKRLVLVADAQDLKKEHLTALERYLASPSPYSVLVLISSSRSKLEALVKPVGAIVTLDAPRGRRLIGWLRERAKIHGLKLDERGGWALTETVGSELRDLDTALTQLSTQLGPAARIGAAEVHEAFGRLADQRIFAFTDAVGDRSLPAAMTSLRRLLDQGDEPLMVFGALHSLFRKLLRARRYVDQGPKAVGDVLGVSGWRAERLQKQARRYREEEIIEAIRILAETDVELKGGDMPPAAALERAVTRILLGAPSPTLS
jgi:DNA polymerase-3 subunit delta